jgi:outer membrane lipoprotein SlyB
MRFPIDVRAVGALMSAAFAIAALAQVAPPSPAACDSCGVVMSIRTATEDSEWTPLGVVSPGTSLTSPGGSETRSAFSFGPDGSRGLVVIGAAGGALYAKRPNGYQRPRWDVTLKMDRGDTRVLTQRYEPLLREGDRVRVMGTQLELIET